MDISLEKIELIRERTGLSYAEARELLEEAGGDVIEALVTLEEEHAGGQDNQAMLRADVLSPVKKVIRQSTHTRIKVSNKDGTLLEIPATLGLAGALLAPRATALGTIALLMAQYSLDVEVPGSMDWES